MPNGSFWNFRKIKLYYFAFCTSKKKRLNRYRRKWSKVYTSISDSALSPTRRLGASQPRTPRSKRHFLYFWSPTKVIESKLKVFRFWHRVSHFFTNNYNNFKFLEKNFGFGPQTWRSNFLILGHLDRISNFQRFWTFCVGFFFPGN